MKKLMAKIMGMIAITFMIAVPTKVLANEIGVQMVHNTNGDYVIYVEGLNTEFDYAISNSSDSNDIDLNYIKSTTDDEGNNVALISNSKYETIKSNENYLYIKNSEGSVLKGKKIDFSDVVEQTNFDFVGNTTKRISTEIINIVKQDEEKNGAKLKTNVGGIKILEEGTYFYTITKLPNEAYTELMDMVNKINNEYDEMDTFNKIATVKEFYKLYNMVRDNQEWLEVKNATIEQPESAENGEQYVIFLKKNNQDGTEITDIKLMESYRNDEIEKIPAKTESKTVQEAAKLPITNDSLILVVALITVVMIAIIVYRKIRKMQKETK